MRHTQWTHWRIPAEGEWQLLDRFLAGEGSPEEQAAVVALVAHDSAIRDLMHFMLGASATANSQYDVQRAWQELRIRMAMNTATSVAVTPSPVVQKPRFQPWTIAVGQSFNRFRDRHRLVKRAGAIGVVCAITAIVLPWKPSPAPAASPNVTMYEMTTQVGERASLRLIDGTRVTVGPQSHMRVSSTFGQQSRTVYLDGEAVFDIAHAPKTPFIVNTQRSVTRVLGTKLGVRAYDNTTTVAVVDGKVSLESRAAATPAVIVTAGYVGTMASDGVAQVHFGNTEEYTAWVQNRFVFHETPLADILDHLSRWYGVRFATVGEGLLQRRLTADWENRSLGSVLRSLSFAFNIKVERHGDEVRLSER